MEPSFNIGNNTGYNDDIKKIELQNAHERSQLHEKNEHEKDILEKRLGWVGKIFGSSENASKNIAATICVLIIAGASIISIIVYITNQDVDFIKFIWEKPIPIITVSLGYIFGKNN